MASKITPVYKLDSETRQILRIDQPLTITQQDRIRKIGGVLYIEAGRSYPTLAIPNDPLAQPPNGGQVAILNRLEAYTAWDSARGDTSIKIGILDTGVDILHPDLAANLARNYRDPINGIDDDGNGLVDDYNGYDLAEMDNNPRPDANSHGTNVASISSAVTDNGLGVAGLGYRCRYLPVKVFGRRFAGFEGIIYAADQGCQVINLSWGGNGYPAQYEQDIIDYATKVRGAVVVAAAGNTPGVLRFFPASYRGVISVSTTNVTDVRDASSTVAQDVDVVAPGINVYGIMGNGNYGNMGGGSSFACPEVAALAALIRHKYPSLAPADVEHRIKATSDWVDTVGANRSTAGYQGRGRINFRRALTGGLKAYVLGDSLLVPTLQQSTVGDTVDLGIKFTNRVTNANQISISVRIWGGQVTAANLLGPDSVVVGPMGKDQTRRIEPRAGWRVLLPAVVNDNLKLLVTFRVDGEVYNQVMIQRRGALGLELTGPEGQLSVGSNARLGYWDGVNSVGAGFTRLGRQLLGQGGLIIARDSLDMRNNVTAVSGKDDEFVAGPVRFVKADTMQVLEQLTGCTPLGTGTMRLTMKVAGYAWPKRADRPGILTEYTIANTGPAAIDTLRFGIMADWDINRYWLDQMRWDSVGGFGYAYAFGDTAFAALVPLTPGMRHGLFAVDVVASTATANLDLTDGFSRAEKWAALKRNRLSAGGGGGTNVLGVHQTRIAGLGIGQKKRVAYAWIGSASLAGLRRAAEQSKAAYRSMRQGPAWLFANQFSKCNSAQFRIAMPQGLWRVYRVDGTLLFTATDTLRFDLVGMRDSLLVENADSLFAGPRSVLTFYRRSLNDSLNVPTTVDVLDTVRFSPALVEAGDTVIVTAQNLDRQWMWDTTANVRYYVPPVPGSYQICRYISTPEGCRSFSCDTFQVLGPTGLRGNLRSSLPYPNPAFGWIAMPATLTAQAVYDSQGRLVWQDEVGKGGTVSTQQWPRGLYLWRSGDERYSIVVH